MKNKKYTKRLLISLSFPEGQGLCIFAVRYAFVWLINCFSSFYNLIIPQNLYIFKESGVKILVFIYIFML